LNSDIFALKSDTVCSNLLDLQMNRSKKNRCIYIHLKFEYINEVMYFVRACTYTFIFQTISYCGYWNNYKHSEHVMLNVLCTEVLI